MIEVHVKESDSAWLGVDYLRGARGWRLVQIFAPSVSVMGGGIPEYSELIFEKEKSI